MEKKTPSVICTHQNNQTARNWYKRATKHGPNAMQCSMSLLQDAGQAQENGTWSSQDTC